MKTLNWVSRLTLVASLASLVSAPLLADAPASCAARPVKTKAPARLFAAASLEKLLDLQGGHPELLEQRAGTEGGITLWYVFVIGAAIGIGGYYAYKANKTAINNLTNSFGGGNNNGNNNNNGN